MWLGLSLLLQEFSGFGSICQVCGEHNFELKNKKRICFLVLLGLFVWEWHLQCHGGSVCGQELTEVIN